METQTLIDRYIQFFTQRGHIHIAPASIVSASNDSTLFISAGMQPLIPYFSGEYPHPQGQRLVDLQPCLRTIDIDEVGDRSHLTFFEMLGNWSLGDYFKAESIEMSLAFLTDWLNIDLDRLWVTVFAGDEATPTDEESPQIWTQLGIPSERIIPLPRQENWWGPIGDTGPCGPDTEIFFDLGGPGCSNSCRPGCSCGRFLEIWNNVFLEYHRTADGRFEPLAQQNVDTGLGADRVAAILQGHSSVFDTELFTPITSLIIDLAQATEIQLESVRVVADHLKAATMVLGAGVRPANKRQGYIVRRLIRRAIDHGKRMGIDQTFTAELANIVIELYAKRYPYLRSSRQQILETLQLEEQSFNRTLQRGRRIFEGRIQQSLAQGQTNLSGQDIFHLFDTYGIPPELTKEWTSEYQLGIDQPGFELALAAHKEISGGGRTGEFAGGLASQDPQTVRLHTATHLLHQALRQVLGEHVAQKGSHITPQRLRFDFSHPTKLTSDELTAVEQEVNHQIEANLQVEWKEMPLQVAEQTGAIGLFGEKYGEIVKVYSIGDYSREICGGPHVTHTGVLGRFHILREQSNGAGIRRIRATVEDTSQH